MSDGDRFEQTRKALDVIGMSDKEVSELLSAVSGVLHLGQASVFDLSVFVFLLFVHFCSLFTLFCVVPGIQ